MDFKKFLEKAAKEIDREVERILKEELNEARKIDKRLAPLLEAFRAACRGGKRIRGVLVLLGYGIGSGKWEVGSGIREVVRIGAAYEIMHAAILAHDDIVDESAIRRGQASLYKKVGISQAITLGDFGFFLSLKIISESNFPEELKAQVLNSFSKIMVDTAIGQMLDIGKGDLLKVAKYKTAEYTISGPLQLGAMLAGAKFDLLDQLDKFGEKLGVAFQIRDDSLDGEGDKLGEAKRLVSSAKKMIPGLTIVGTKDQYMSKLLEQMAEYLVHRTK